MPLDLEKLVRRNDNYLPKHLARGATVATSDFRPHKMSGTHKPF